MQFGGFPVEAMDWFRGIEANNSRPWFLEHKPEYEQAIRQPLESMLEELAPEFGEAKVFRPNRDTRFSSDKSPYKTAAAASIPAKGGGFYVHLSAEGLMAGAGMYHMARDQLARFRDAIDDERSGSALAELVADARRARLDVSAHEHLATAPRGYAKDHPRIDLLRLKGLVVAKQFTTAKWLHTAAAENRVKDVWRSARPLMGWLADHVGGSDSGME
jgi:uncharacterized protein (TIGR02453 family)